MASNMLTFPQQGQQIFKAHKAYIKPWLKPAKLQSTLRDGNQTKLQAFGNQREPFSQPVSWGDFPEMMNT